MFSDEICEALDNYVYALVEPGGRVFYIGKGEGNRVFQHAKDEFSDYLANGDETEVTAKMETIRAIRNNQKEVECWIIRHGLDSSTAYHAEAALIDLFRKIDPSLTNLVGGHGSSSLGLMTVAEISELYGAPPLEEFQHKVIMININQTFDRKDVGSNALYEMTRFAWKMSLQRARKADLVLAVSKGLVRGVFEPERWLGADVEGNFPGRDLEKGRIGFIGTPAPDNLADHYLGKRIPDKFRRRGAANPIRYSYQN